MFLDNYPRLTCRGEIIKRLISEPISKIVKSPFVVRELKKLDGEAGKAKKIFRNISVLKDKVMLVDTTRTKNFIPRYLEYFLHPQIKYSVRIERVDDGYHISAGKNPWKKMSARIYFGEMLKKYGGGGHKTVGGADRKSKSEILKIAGEVIEYLRRNG